MQGQKMAALCHFLPCPHSCGTYEPVATTFWTKHGLGTPRGHGSLLVSHSELERVRCGRAPHEHFSPPFWVALCRRSHFRARGGEPPPCGLPTTREGSCWILRSTQEAFSGQWPARLPEDGTYTSFLMHWYRFQA